MGVWPSDRAPKGSAYYALIRAELKGEMDRKSSLEQRGLAVISTSGALATLLIGLITLGQRMIDLPQQPILLRTLLATALIALTLAASAGLAAAAPWNYRLLGNESLDYMVSAEGWYDSHTRATWRIAETQAKFVKCARAANGRKATTLLLAMLLEVLAIGLLCACVMLALV